MIQEAVQETVRQWWLELKEDKYTLGFSLVFLLGITLFGGYKAKRWYDGYQERGAQLPFSQALDEYDRVLHQLRTGTVTSNALWDEARLGFQEVQTKHAGTAFSRYAQIFQADIEARQGSTEQAIASLEAVSKQLSEQSPLYHVLKTKAALLQFDAGKAQEAVAALTDLANDQANPQRDTAAFFLGYYYWEQDELEKARQAWEPFEASRQLKESEERSPWAPIAQMKLAQIA